MSIGDLKNALGAADGNDAIAAVVGPIIDDGARELGGQQAKITSGRFSCSGPVERPWVCVLSLR
ncbi:MULTISPECIES: hypothetical protein [Cyanophyceae]|uniref:hypothetical protein n=1 Tax=Cyanophyceae TaxID=3028117 RepID=UPI0016855848|nr:MULTISPECIES: hypothetical protein [Cyanophyceae]MBD1917383.1 hypothetical protein [Phormidium sp. FACHB-77]MBD2032372.1 hypothetical protein [Phormidium sp. FACHB-322]MBD2052310.1 hypothetical protein [Leptolyngbya sp. FACHB-60]